MKITPDTFSISFDHAEGLHSNGGDAIYGFESAGKDEIFTPLPAATIDGERILLHDVPNDASWIRFAWTPCPATHLFNRHGLPAAPFRIAVSNSPRTTHPNS